MLDQISNRILRLARPQGLTFASIERELGFGNGTLRKWGKNIPACDKVLMVANLLNCSVDYLLTGKSGALLNDEVVELVEEWEKLDSRSKSIFKGEILKRVDELRAANINGESTVANINNKKLSAPSHTYNKLLKSVPVLGQTAGGLPIDRIENITDFITVEADEREASLYNYALKVSGNSMCEAGIDDGDYVVVHQTPHVENGTIAVVSVNDETTVKKFYHKGGHIELVPCNPAHETQRYSMGDNIAILGEIKLVIKQSDFEAASKPYIEE